MNMPRIVTVVGDSLSNTEPDNWVALVAQSRPDLHFTVEAHGGWTTHSYFKPKFDGIAFAQIPAHVDLFILLLGSNNLFEDQGGRDATLVAITDGIRRIADHLTTRSPQAQFLLVAPPTVCLRNNTSATRQPDRLIADHTPHYLRQLGQHYRQLATNNGWEFVDLYPLLTDDDFLDVAHPNPSGNRKIAQAILTVLARINPLPNA